MTRHETAVAMASSTAPVLGPGPWPLGLFSILELGRRVSVSAALVHTGKGHCDLLYPHLQVVTVHMEVAEAVGRGWQGIIVTSLITVTEYLVISNLIRTR